MIVTPALADANNGNWQTAQRWARMLQPAYRVQLTNRWPGADAAAGPAPALMIALHARRSAASVAAWRSSGARRPLLLVLTGTDLYRDIDTDPSAQQSLAAADVLVVLNALGAQRLPVALRPRCQVVLQSCARRQPLAKTNRHLNVLMVGHLRDEKDPRTYFDAVALLANRHDLQFAHIGAALDPALGQAATGLMRSHPHYRWLGALPHSATRQRIQAAHVLVHPSRMEGGAHVVIEAMRSGTPVIASRIDGNLGLLGSDYAGCFAPGDAQGLAALLQQARDDPDMLPALQRQIDQREALFSPAAEQATLQQLVSALLTRPS